MSKSLPCSDFKELIVALKIRRKEKETDYMTIFNTKEYPMNWIKVLEGLKFKVFGCDDMFRIEYN